MLDPLRTAPGDIPEAATFSIDEVAQAAGVPVEEAWRVAGLGQAVVYGPRGFVTLEDATHLVRVLRGSIPPSANLTPLNLKPEPRGKGRVRAAAAGAFYILGAALLIVVSSLGLLSASATDEIVEPEREPVRMVYLITPGPGGGGGGGGLRAPTPPPPAKKKAPVPARNTASPVPPARPRPAPPTPTPTPAPRPELRVEYTKIESKPVPMPTPPPAVQAPVRSIPTDAIERVGLPVERPDSSPSQGRGTGGGVGSGAGSGIGEGTGGGIGPGSGGGTGGGPYQPGSGIDPPTLVREVRPTYTDEARRKSIEGDVVLEIVVRNDGTVGNVRVRRSLGAGLEQRAIDAVRQWKFVPAKRKGAPVDVVVDVSVEFKLR